MNVHKKLVNAATIAILTICIISEVIYIKTIDSDTLPTADEIVNTGTDNNKVEANEIVIIDTDEIPTSEGVYYLDLSYFQLWESGDYDTSNGEISVNKRRLRYVNTIKVLFDVYSVHTSDDYSVKIYEYDSNMKFIKYTTVTGDAEVTPDSATAYLRVSLYRNYDEKKLSLGQWNRVFGDVKVTVSHGSMEAYSLNAVKNVITASETTVSASLMSDMLLNNNSRQLADALWNNQVANGIYSLTSEELDNGNLTLYFSTSDGDDENSGLSAEYPKKTLSAYSGMSRVNILLKCGDTFDMAATFTVGSNSMVAAYGEGTRPVLSYYRNLELTFEPVAGCSNVWMADMSGMGICNNVKSKSNCNIGQLVINGEVNWLRKVGSTKDTFDPSTLSNAADGSWAADWNTNCLYMYSEKNPNDLNITYAPPIHGIVLKNVDNVTIKGIEITGAGCHGINMTNVGNVEVTCCYINHIGGSILTSAGVRYGNAIQLWNSGTDVNVSYNYADWIFDTCYTNQGSSATTYESNVLFYRNIGAHSFWGLETWGDGYSVNGFGKVEYSENIIYAMMDITNPTQPMYVNKSGKVIFAQADMTKEAYVSYRCAYTYHQMSSVNVSNSGTGELVGIHDNLFWGTNRFLAIFTNSRDEDVFSCLSNNIFYCETDVAGTALFRYTNSEGTKLYLEGLQGYTTEDNYVSVHSISEMYVSNQELSKLTNMLSAVAGIN